MKLDRPIFILGAGRTGSTIFHRILCEHPSVSWLTTLTDRFPDRPRLSRSFMHLASLPVAGAGARRVYPSECYEMWDSCCPCFSRSFRDLGAGDVTPPMASRARSTLEQIPTRQRNRLSVKITGWPRIGFLREIFPDALFIHLRRDGRNVASSFLNVSWWLGWRGPGQWRWGELNEAYREEWEHHDLSFVALVGIQWKIFMDALEASTPQIPSEQFLDIRYENLCHDPERLFDEILEFCGLDSSPVFRQRLSGFRIENDPEKWRKNLNTNQQKILESVIGEYLTRYGYQ